MTCVSYHEAARDELLVQVAYLERRAQGLGRRFLAEVRRAEDLMAQFPDAAKEVRSGIRKHVLRKFPYSLIYATEAGGPLILAIAHHSRRPEYWVSRLDKGEGAESGP